MQGGGATTFARRIVIVHSPCVVCIVLPSIRLLHKNHVGRGACAKLEKKKEYCPGKGVKLHMKSARAASTTTLNTGEWGRLVLESGPYFLL